MNDNQVFCPSCGAQVAGVASKVQPQPPQQPQYFQPQPPQQFAQPQYVQPQGVPQQGYVPGGYQPAPYPQPTKMGAGVPKTKGKGLVIGLIAGGVAVIAVVVVLIVVFAGKKNSKSEGTKNKGGTVKNYEDLVEIYVNAYNTGNADGIIDNMYVGDHPLTDDQKDDLDDACSDVRDFLDEQYGSGAVLTYEISEKTPFDQDTIEEANQLFGTNGDKVTEGYSIYLDLTVKGEDATFEDNLLVVKCSKGWMIALPDLGDYSYKDYNDEEY